VLLPNAESVTFDEARAVLLAARAVDDEHGVSRQSDSSNLGYIIIIVVVCCSIVMMMMMMM
jgi:hypothetical protein